MVSAKKAETNGNSGQSNGQAPSKIDLINVYLESKCPPKVGGTPFKANGSNKMMSNINSTTNL